MTGSGRFKANNFPVSNGGHVSM